MNGLPCSCQNWSIIKLSGFLSSWSLIQCYMCLRYCMYSLSVSFLFLGNYNLHLMDWNKAPLTLLISEDISLSSMCQVNSQCRELGELYFKDSEGPMGETILNVKSPLVGLHYYAKTPVFFKLIQAFIQAIFIQCLLVFLHKWIMIHSIFMGHLLYGLKHHASFWGQSKDVWGIFSAHKEITNSKGK